MPLNVSHSSEEFTAPTSVQELFSKKGNNSVLAKLLARGGSQMWPLRWQQHTSLGACSGSIACSATFLPLILSNCRRQTKPAPESEPAGLALILSNLWLFTWTTILTSLTSSYRTASFSSRGKWSFGLYWELWSKCAVIIFLSVKCLHVNMCVWKCFLSVKCLWICVYGNVFWVWSVCEYVCMEMFSECEVFVNMCVWKCFLSVKCLHVNMCVWKCFLSVKCLWICVYGNVFWVWSVCEYVCMEMFSECEVFVNMCVWKCFLSLKCLWICVYGNVFWVWSVCEYVCMEMFSECEVFVNMCVWKCFLSLKCLWICVYVNVLLHPTKCVTT